LSERSEDLMKRPLISVVVPAYGHEEFIERCLRSIWEQDYDNIEVIVLDDRSKDRTFHVAKRFLGNEEVRSKFRRVVCERNHKNVGAHETLNRGIAMATGEYVSLINSDDTYYPGRLSRLLEELRRTGSRLAFSAVRCIDDEDHVAYGLDADSIPISAARRARDNLPSQSFGFLRYQQAISTGNLFFERTLFEEIGGFIPLKYCHDWDFTLQAVVRTEPVYVDEVLYGYRLHGRNSFRALSDQAAIETEVVLTRYFKTILLMRAPNRLAPTPYNWPEVFSTFTRVLGVRHFWHSASHQTSVGSRVYER